MAAGERDAGAGGPAGSGKPAGLARNPRKQGVPGRASGRPFAHLIVYYRQRGIYWNAAGGGVPDLHRGDRGGHAMVIRCKKPGLAGGWLIADLAIAMGIVVLAMLPLAVSMVHEQKL